MLLESRSGLIRDTASWAVHATGASKVLVLSVVNQAGGTVSVQLSHIFQHVDGVLKQNDMTRGNVVSWDCTCDNSVPDGEFYQTIMPALATFFKDSAVKPAATNVTFTRLLQGRLIQVQMTAMA